MGKQDIEIARAVTLKPIQEVAEALGLEAGKVARSLEVLALPAGRGELRHKGPTTAFTAVEVDGAERDRVIAAFHAKTPKPFRRDFDQRPDAADHPTFRVDPVEHGV